MDEILSRSGVYLIPNQPQSDFKANGLPSDIEHYLDCLTFLYKQQDTQFFFRKKKGNDRISEDDLINVFHKKIIDDAVWGPELYYTTVDADFQNVHVVASVAPQVHYNDCFWKFDNVNREDENEQCSIKLQDIFQVSSFTC
jgi:hypothetical protein